MNDHDKTKEQLVAELAEMRRRVAELVALESERRPAEEALRESEQWARCVFETVPLGITECTLDGRLTRSNPAYERMLGYSSDELAGKSIVELLEDGPDKEAFPAYLKHLATEQPTPSPYLCRDVTKDGRHIDVQVNWTYKRNSQGEVTGFVSVLSDITEKKRAEVALQESERALREAHEQLEQRVKDRTAELEEANQRLAQKIAEREVVEVSLRESEERYKTLVETSPHAVIMSDLEGRITFASRRTTELHGCETVRELYGRDPLGFVVPEDHDKFRTNMQRIFESGVLRNIEYTLVRQDGTHYAAELSSSLIRDSDGQPQAMMAVIQDITKRKEAQEALRQSRDQLEAINSGMFDGLAVADIETKRLVRTNPALCRMLGYSEDELSSLSVMDIHPPEDVPNVLEKFQAQAEGRSVVAEEIPLLRKDRSIFYADITATAIDYLGRRCSIGVFHDITARKQVEEALRREYRVLREMLKAQDRERQLVAYEIHDGLAQQLTSATMQFETSEQLRNGNPQQASDCYSAGLHLLRESVAEARRLIAGLRPPILDEAGIVAALAHLIHDVMAQDGPEVQFHSSVKFKRLDPIIENAIFRIAQESLTNVCRHSKSNTAEVRLVQAGDHVQVEVHDWGAGFDPDDVEEGCFGLAGIQERARVLGGWATIESTPGQGTVVRAKLPLMESK